jgi:hypothetical protein
MNVGDTRKWSIARTCLACSLLGTLAVSCGTDGVPMSECEFGLYWADCGGNGEPLLGCDRSTGDCRWFANGLAAQNHAVSDCPADDVCCHDAWPFEDFSPSADILEHARASLSLARTGVLTRRGVSDVSVVADLVGGSRSLTIRCLGGGEPTSFPCSDVGSGGSVARLGESVVILFERGSYRFELEVVTGESPEQWSVNLYHSQVWMRDPTPVASCNNYRVGTEWVVSGVLHLNTLDHSDLDSFHGRFDGEIDGNQFVMEF